MLPPLSHLSNQGYSRLLGAAATPTSVHPLDVCPEHNVAVPHCAVTIKLLLIMIATLTLSLSFTYILLPLVFGVRGDSFEP